MRFTSKLSPEQWAEARCMRAGGASYAAIGEHFAMRPASIARRAQKERWSATAGGASKGTAGAKPGPGSPGTAGIRARLAERLYRVIEYKIKMMELRMIEHLQAHLQRDGHEPDGAAPPASINDERESFAALIESINKVTEMASEPAPADDGRRRAAASPIDPELTALSDDIDPGGLAAASEKDALRREIAERLAKIFPPA